MVKLTGCLGVLFLCSIGIAAAQGVPTLPVSPDTVASLMAKVRRPAAATNGALAQQKDPPANGAGSTLNGPGNVPLGRNTFHATNCEWFSDGTNQFLIVFPLEGGFWFIENNIFAADTFLTGCVRGDFVSVDVTDANTGAFEDIITYPVR
jgi:hypothetical protein